MIDIVDVKKLLKTLAGSQQSVVLIDGYRVLNRERYKFFLKSGLYCKCCGIKASFARLEKDITSKTGLYHLFFYIKKDGREIKLTIDHIVPKALKGKNEIENYQVLCEKCNRDKGDNIIKF